MKKLFITFILSTYTVIIHASSYCANQISINVNYLKTQKQIEKIEIQLANNKTIAQKADKILLGLIEQKSPTIISWIKKRNLNPAKDDELIAKKWRHYFLTDFMFRAYPVNEADIDLLIEKHFNQINKMVFTKKLVSKLEKLFTLAKELSIKKILLTNSKKYNSFGWTTLKLLNLLNFPWSILIGALPLIQAPMKLTWG